MRRRGIELRANAHPFSFPRGDARRLARSLATFVVAGHAASATRVRREPPPRAARPRRRRLARRSARRAAERRPRLQPRPPWQRRRPGALVLVARHRFPANSNGLSNGRSRRHRPPLVRCGGSGGARLHARLCRLRPRSRSSRHLGLSLAWRLSRSSHSKSRHSKGRRSCASALRRRSRTLCRARRELETPARSLASPIAPGSFALKIVPPAASRPPAASL